MHDRRAGVQRDMLPAGIDQMQIFPAGAGQRPIADHAVLGVEDNLLVAEIEIRAQGRDADAEIDDPAILEFHRQAVAHLLPAQPRRLVAHPDASPERNPRNAHNGYTMGTGIPEPFGILTTRSWI